MKSTAAATLVALSLAALTVTLADAAAKQESGRGRNGKLREFVIDRLFGYKMVPRLRQSSRLRVPATLYCLYLHTPCHFFAVSMFNIVKFPNDECEGDTGKNGTCYTGES